MANSFSTIPAYTLSWLYAAAFGRTPVPSATAGKGDANGLDYWTNQFLGGTGAQAVFTNNVYAIADFFVTSAEFLAKYPTAMTSGDFVTALYKNQLGRTPDLAGYNYWVGRLESGQSRGQVLADFSNVPENQNANTLRKDAINNYIIYVANDADHIISDAEAATWLALNPTFDAAKIDATGSTGGQTFTLTDKVDVIPGLIGSNGTTSTAGDDLVIAGEGSNATTHTLGSSDVINTGEGMDRMNLRLADVNPAAVVGQTVTPNMTSVEKVYTQALNSVAGGSNAINAINVTGTTEWWSDNSTATLIVNNVNEKAAVGVIGGDADAAEVDDYLVGFKSSAVTGNLAVVLQGVTLDDLGVSAQDGVAEFATWDISVTGTANSSIDTLTDNLQNPVANLTTINVSGDKRLTIDDVLAGVTTINAGAQTAGGVRVVVDTTKNITFTGGAGTDRVDVGAAGLDLNDKLDGGTGTDTFRISSGVMLTTALAGNVKGFEIFEGRGTAQTYNLDAMLPNNTLTEVILNPDNLANITVDNIPSTATTSIRAVQDEIGTATLTAKNFIQGGTTDTATLILDNKAAGTRPGFASGVDIATLDFARVDNLNIQSVSDGTPAVGEENSIAALTAGDLEVITITGDNGVVLTTTATSNAVTKVDASGLVSTTTGLTLLTVNLSADTAGEGAEIIGTAQKDVITSTAVNIAGKGDNITAGAGSDTVNLSTTALARNNTLNYTAATLSSGDIAADTQDTVTAIAVGDRINMTAGVEGQLKVNGLLLSATAANQTLTAAAFDINNNIIAVDKGADRAIQIDLNGDGLFTSTLDFEILLAGRAGTTVQYDATNDYFAITALGGGGGGGGAVASNTLTNVSDTFNNRVAPTSDVLGGVTYTAPTLNSNATLFTTQANIAAGDTLNFGTGTDTLTFTGQVTAFTINDTTSFGGATVRGLDILQLADTTNSVTVTSIDDGLVGDSVRGLTINGGTQRDDITVTGAAATATAGNQLAVNTAGGNDLVALSGDARGVTVNTGDGDDEVRTVLANFTGTTAGPATSINGGTGANTLKITGTLAALGTPAQWATVSNIQTLDLRGITSADATTLDLSSAAAQSTGIVTVFTEIAAGDKQDITTGYGITLNDVGVASTAAAGTDGIVLSAGSVGNLTVNQTAANFTAAAAAATIGNINYTTTTGATSQGVVMGNGTNTINLGTTLTTGDTVTGGTGTDTLVITGSGTGSVNITAVETIQFTTSTVGQTFTTGAIAAGSALTSITAAGSTVGVTIDAALLADTTTIITGSAFGDTITSTDAAVSVTIVGGAGSDTITLDPAGGSAAVEVVGYTTANDGSAAGVNSGFDAITAFKTSGADQIRFGGTLFTALDDNGSAALITAARAQNAADAATDEVVILSTTVGAGTLSNTDFAGFRTALGTVNNFGTAGAEILVVANDGTNTGLYLITNVNNNTTVDANEVQLLGTVNGVLVAGDFTLTSL